MSSGEHPDRDSLSAYLEESLSIDATQWIKQHLNSCGACRTKLEQERVFLERLDGLCSVKPPADFTQGVMARVAQYPTYHPAAEVPLKGFLKWGVGAVAAGIVVALFIGWMVVASGTGPGVEVPAGASAFTTAIEWTVWLWESARGVGEPLMQPLEAVWGVVEFVREAPLMVQLALLLVTVGLNYALTRMVLNYQRRQ
jgi:hypothetical protein